MTRSTPICPSVVVPSFQSAATISACLASVLAQDFDGPFDVVVADSGTDETAAIVGRAFPGVRCLSAPARLDPAEARNWGAREAGGNVLAFIDSDCVADRDWLRRLCETLARGYEAAGGSIRISAASNAAQWAGYFCEFREFLPDVAAADRANLTLGNAAYTRAAFERIGGFPAGHFPQEDQVFHRRLIDAGGRIRFEPSIAVTHQHRSTVAAFLAHQRRIGAANVRVVVELGARGSALAAHPAVAALGLPALATYRFARTIAACWRAKRGLLVRRPDVLALCWLGMCAWAAGFARESAAAGAGPTQATVR